MAGRPCQIEPVPAYREGSTDRYHPATDPHPHRWLTWSTAATAPAPGTGAAWAVGGVSPSWPTSRGGSVASAWPTS